MPKFRRKLLSVMLVCLVATGLFIQAKQDDPVRHSDWTYVPPLFGADLFASNRYGQPDDDAQVVFDSIIPEGFVQIATSSQLALYLDESNAVFIVRNIATGYLWYSDAQDLENANLNATMRALMRSPVHVEYFPYTAATDRLSTTTRRQTLYDATFSFLPIKDGIQMDVMHQTIDIGYTVNIVLDNHQLVVSLEQDSLTEGNHKIATLALFPNFGATRHDEVPGYMLIPDGPGALYRFKDNADRMPVQFSSRYYGHDRGIRATDTRNPLTHMSLPIFGMVHGRMQHGFLGIVESGAYNANFMMSPSGANAIEYNTTGVQFILRETYVFPTNLSGDGITTVMGPRHDEDMSIRFLFPEPAQADYVGLANLYQTYLVDTGHLGRHAAEVPRLRVELLMADSEPGLFGPQTIVMTTVAQAYTILEDLLAHSVNAAVVLRGWNRGGYSETAPYTVTRERALGNTSDWTQLHQLTTDHDILLHYYHEAVQADDRTREINLRSDLMRGIYRRQIEAPSSDVNLGTHRFVQPEKTRQLLTAQSAQFAAFGTLTIALDTMGRHLFSNYDGQWHSRAQTPLTYQESLQAMNQELALYQPNTYLFGFTSAYFDLPLYSSQFTFYDDLIPFLPLVMQGRIDAYAPFANFYANPIEQRLMLVDFNVYPSFILTHEASHRLRFSPARQFFSTEYAVWRAPLFDLYDYVAEALGPVAGRQVVFREVFTQGAVATGYDNGIVVVVNYNEEAVDYQGVTIMGQSYRHTEVQP